MEVALHRAAMGCHPNRPIDRGLTYPVHNEAMYLLRVGYDSDYRVYSPGHLITARTITFGVDHLMHVLGFLGEEMS